MSTLIRLVRLLGLRPGRLALSVGLGIPAQNMDRTLYNALMERKTTLADVRVSTVERYAAALGYSLDWKLQRGDRR